MKSLLRPRWAPGVWCALLLIIGPSPAWTQDSPPPLLERASTEQLLDQLAPQVTTTRSLHRNLVPTPRQIDLVVNFDFDSDRLQPASRPLLENLAQAMRSPRLEGMRFTVEGHTDARGSARYNDDLSMRRARSVATFLAAQGVSAERLQAMGRGSTQLLNPELPESATNRRVRIIASMP